MDLAEIALLLGVANGLLLLLKPVGRLHSRIDHLEHSLVALERDVGRLIGAASTRDRNRLDSTGYPE